MVCLKTRSKVQKADFALAKPAYGSKPCRLRRRFASPSREIRISKNPHKTDSWSSSSPESTFLALQSTMSSPDYPTLATIKSRDEFFRQVGANNMSSVVEIIDQHKCQDDFRCTHVADPYTLLLPHTTQAQKYIICDSVCTWLEGGLCHAASNGHREMFDFLEKKVAKPNKIDWTTILWYASSADSSLLSYITAISQRTLYTPRKFRLSP